MSSIGSYIAQTKTHSYAVTQAAPGDAGAYFFAQSDFDAWVVANAGKINQLGDVYVIPGSASGATFLDVLLGQNGATELGHSLPNITERKTITDMGRQITIGNYGNSRMLVFRLVQAYGLASQSGLGAAVGYVVVENNVDDLQGTTGRFSMRVARA